MFKNIARVLGSNLGVTFIGIINSFLLPRLLSIDDYSTYQTFTLYMTYTACMHLGFPSGLFIKYGGHKFEELDHSRFKTEYRIMVTIPLVFTILALAIALFCGNAMFFFVAINILPYCVVGSFKSLYQAWGEFGKYSIINFFIPCTTLIINLMYYLKTNRLSYIVCISSFTLSYFVVYTYMTISAKKRMKYVKAGGYVTTDNWKILKNGFALMIGNYINTLILSIDRQFVKIFFGDIEFAIYSFAMSLQAIMVVFITSIAQPLYSKIAKGHLSEDYYKRVEEVLMIFGSFSGCAYYVCVFVIQKFIPKYIDSIKVIGYYFLVFPVLAVINCLIVNLYKATGNVARYLKNLVVVFAVSIMLNSIVIIMQMDYVLIAVATVGVYFVWYTIGVSDFSFLRPTTRDVLFIFTFVLLLLSMVYFVQNAIIGLLVYFVLDVALVLLIYHKNLYTYFKMMRE